MTEQVGQLRYAQNSTSYKSRLDQLTGMRKETPADGRRNFLRAAGATVLTGFAGCLGEETTPEPVNITEDHSCAVCNMIVHNHPGPSGHAFYPDDPSVYGVQEPGVVPFCSSVCAYDYYFELDEEGISPREIYLTDYSTVDWEVFEQGETKFISAHFESTAQTSFEDLFFVVDSEILGAMGEAAIGFSDEDDAEAFADKYDGDVYPHSDITRELIESLGFV